ncbi:MAG: four helix bundle protein [Vicinamibacterales bacterium]
MRQADLKERTMVFALGVSSLCQELQADWRQRRLADQLFRSATSVAANYYAASRARSRREFVAKLGLVAEEAEETAFWLDFARRAGMMKSLESGRLAVEARELLAIFIASLKTASAGTSTSARR